MTEYTAAMIGSVSVLFFYAYLAINLSEKHDQLKMFLLLSGMVMSWGILNLANATIKGASGAGVAVDAASDYIYYIAIVIGGLVLIYFVLWFLFHTISAAIKRRRGDGDDYGL